MRRGEPSDSCVMRRVSTIGRALTVVMCSRVLVRGAEIKDLMSFCVFRSLPLVLQVSQGCDDSRAAAAHRTEYTRKMVSEMV